MKIKCIVVLGLTTFGLMAFAGCGGDDSANTSAETPPPETTAAPELSAEAVVALDRLGASLDRLKLLAASFPDCGKEAQSRREWHRARRLVNELSAASGITYRHNKKHLPPQQADEIRSRVYALYETEGSILPALHARGRKQRELEQAAQ
jgi:hypothetical protein